MPTSSSAQPILTFSSTLLSSIDRLLRGIESRFVPTGAFKSIGRTEGFLDRFFSARFASLGLLSERVPLGFDTRDAAHPQLSAVESWIPSTAELRGLPGSPNRMSGIAPSPTGRAQASPLKLPFAAPDERKSVPAATGPGQLPRQADGMLRESPTVAAGEPRTSTGMLPVGAQTEQADLARVKEVLQVSSRQPEAALAQRSSLPVLTALGRSFQHLGWSDARMGLQVYDPFVAAHMGHVSASEGSAVADSVELGAGLPSRVLRAGDLLQSLPAREERESARTADSRRTVGQVSSLRQTEQGAGRVAAETRQTGSAAVRTADKSIAATVTGSAVPEELVGAGGLAEAAPVAMSAATSGRAEVAQGAAEGNRGETAGKAKSATAVGAQGPHAVDADGRGVSSQHARTVPRFDPGAPLHTALSSSLWPGRSDGISTEPASATAASILPSLAKPWSAPGVIGAQVERLAALVSGSHATVSPSASTHSASQWIHAPGVPAQVARRLAAFTQTAETSAAIVRPGVEALPFAFYPTAEEPVRFAKAAQPVATARAAASANAPASGEVSSVQQVLRSSTPMSAPPATWEANLPHVVSEGRDTPREPEKRISQVAVGREPAAAQSVSAPGAATFARPWLSAGGTATLAELFAAGVGLAAGMSQQSAGELGVSSGPSLVPPWLLLPRQLDAQATAQVRGVEREVFQPQLLFPVSDSRAGRETASEPSARGFEARAVPTAISQRAASVATEHPSANPAASAWERPQTSSERRAVDPSVQVPVESPVRFQSEEGRFGRRSALGLSLGAVGAQSEAFARDHGVARPQELGYTSTGASERMQSRFERSSGLPFALEPYTVARQSLPSQPTSQSTSQSQPTSKAKASSAEVPTDGKFAQTPFVRPALLSPQPAPTSIFDERAAFSAQSQAVAQVPAAGPGTVEPATSAPVTSFPPGTLSLGALSLRSEALARKVFGAWNAPTESALGHWHRAPGVSARLSSAFEHAVSGPSSGSGATGETGSRWAIGPSGLSFVYDPIPTATEDAARKDRKSSVPQRIRAEKGGLPTEQPQKVTVGNTDVASSAISIEHARPTAVQAFVPAPLLDERAAFAAGSAAATTPEAPWRGLGGLGMLAELFAANVGVGTGAAAAVAHSLDVSSEKSLWPQWLTQLITKVSASETGARKLRELGLPVLELPTASPVSAVSGPKVGPTAKIDSSVRTPQAPTMAAPDRLLAGGLAATAESFAKRHGIVSVETATEFAGRQDEAEAAPTGRWLSVSGGLVFIPQDEKPTAKRGETASQKPMSATGTTRKEPTQTGSMSARLTDVGVVPTGVGSPSFAQTGGLGLRSELFSALLGPQRSGTSRQVDGSWFGWEDIVPLLASLPKRSASTDSTNATAPSRWALQTDFGLFFFPEMAGERGLSIRGAKPVLAQPTTKAPLESQGNLLGNAMPQATQVSPSKFATVPRTLSEQLFDRHSPSDVPLDLRGTPLLPLLASPQETGRKTGRGVEDVQRAFSQQVLSGFPKQRATGESQQVGEMRTTLWPNMAMQQVERMEKLLSQLPSDWQPSTKVVSAVRQSGVALTPLWQELPRQIQQLRPYEKLEPTDAPRAQLPQISTAVAARSPSLSVVSSTEPARRESPTDDSSKQVEKQRAMEQAMQEAVTAMIKSGGQAAASARLLDAIRSHATSSATRSDERLNLGDLTMIALSMGQQRIAASSPDHPKDRLEPNVASALRMEKRKHVEDDKNSYRKTVKEHAEKVVEYMKASQSQGKSRGQF